MKSAVNLFILFLALTALSGCGIKPSRVSAPPGASDKVFPHQYPSPSTFPRPGS